MTNYVTNGLGVFGSEFDERLNLTLTQISLNSCLLSWL